MYIILTFYKTDGDAFRKNCGKRRKCWLQIFSPFCHDVFRRNLFEGHMGLYGKGLKIHRHAAYLKGLCL